MSKFKVLKNQLKKPFIWIATRPWWQSTSIWISKQPNWKIAILGISSIIVFSMLFLVVLILFIRMGTFGALPNYAQLGSIQNNQASEIYDQRGLSIGKYYLENRVNADSSELPEYLTQALVATEDARFFDHEGIDIRSLVRVLIRTLLLSDESAGGGSTISQQLAKNLYPRRDYRFMSIIVNKLREMLVARRLEKTYPKEQILRLYLNTVPFEGNAFGVKIAAQRFFNKSLEDLKLEEAAVLVGMLKGTSYYNPVRFPERATDRRNTVLNQMVKFGYLHADTAKILTKKELKIDYQPEGHNLGLATYFREHLRQEIDQKLKEISKADGSNYNLYTDGLKVFTTIDGTMQRYAEQVMREHLNELQKIFLKEWQGKEPWFTKSIQEMLIKRSDRHRNLKTKGFSESEIIQSFDVPVPMTIFDYNLGEKEVEMTPLDSIRYYFKLLQAGMLVVEPQSGAVKVWVGGIDHRFLQYDHVKANRQIGSVMKPIVYATALRQGISPCEYFENALVKYPEYKDWEPHNSDEVYGGFYSMEGALSQSINTIAVEVALETGLEPIRALAHELGMEEDIPSEPAIALGAVDASLWQMVGVYCTFANQGKRTEINFLDRVETTNGEILYKNPGIKSKKMNPVLSPDEAAVITHFLQSVVDNGTGRRLRYEYGLNGAIAGKTGTTQNQSDGWFIGYTPGLVAGVWVGAEMPIVHFKTTEHGQGANTALPIWGRFMKKVQGNKRTAQYLKGDFTPPSDSLLMEIDCPNFLPEMPEFFDSIFDLEQLLEFSQNVADIDTAQLVEIMEKSQRKNTETLSEYSLRIKERNQKIIEKRARKKKRK
ncbi:MAG: transglycosylase domain-containing protein [Saprospiraceae bacterium]|nr:transglycosylase domain-containing protein [Saprospiraceae bacterium]